MEAKKDRLNLWDRLMMAITFAEADEAGTARDMLKRPGKEKRIGSTVRKQAEKRPRLKV